MVSKETWEDDPDAADQDAVEAHYVRSNRELIMKKYQTFHRRIHVLRTNIAHKANNLTKCRACKAEQIGNDEWPEVLCHNLTVRGSVSEHGQFRLCFMLSSFGEVVGFWALGDYLI